jgi:hypothetical protein
MASQFARLRFAAMRGDPEQAQLSGRFAAMDAKLDQGNLTPAQIEDMAQWHELTDKLLEVEDALSGSPPSWKSLFENLGEAEQMIGNARYRVESASAGYRSVAMIPKGSPAHAMYAAKLAAFEIWLANIQSRLAVLGGSAAAPVDITTPSFAGLASNAADPRAALARMQSLRVAYDARIQEAATALPQLATTETWSYSYRLGQRTEEAHRTHPDLFNRLRVTEFALRSAVGQARTLVATATPTLSGELQALIEREARSAERAMRDRRDTSGLLFPDELDAEVAARQTVEDRDLAATIDAAYPRTRLAGEASAAEPAPLASEEIEALQSDELKGMSARMTSTERQLGRAWGNLRQIRGIDLRAPDFENMRRFVRDRDLYIVSGQHYWTWDTSFPADSTRHDMPTSREPLVAWLGDAVLGTTTFWSFSETYLLVIAINADAVDVLGPNPLYIRWRDLAKVDSEYLASRARRVAAPGTPAKP